MVSYYLYSKNVDMGPLLKWAEKQLNPISGFLAATVVGTAKRLVEQDDLKEDDERCPTSTVEADPEVLAHHLWGFLNISLTDDAWEIFGSADVGNGLEVWRLVNLDTTQKTEWELMEMEDLVQIRRDSSSAWISTKAS